MKNKITSLTLFAALLLGGCTRDMQESTSGLSQDDALLFSAEGSASTRTEVSTDDLGGLLISWNDTDKVGIYGTSDGRSTGDNFAYTATPFKQDPSRCTFTADDSQSGMFKWINGTDQGYYAYYPYQKVTDRQLTPAAHPFSLPARQTQDKADSPTHIARYGLMTAAPVAVSGKDPGVGSIRFQFANLFSIVEIRLKMDPATSLASVPVKQVSLTSETADLAIPAGTVDLTQPVDADAPLPIFVEEGSRTVSVDFNTQLGLSKSAYTSIYLIVAPGQHPADDIKVEITAIDNSVNSFTMPTEVTFRPNKHYVRDFVLTLDGFVQADEFEADIPQLSCKVGQPLAVTMSGVADKVDFWSGEEGHDYTYSNKDRMQSATMTVNFWSMLQNGYQRAPLKIKYSTDFNGTMDEQSIQNATWTDVSGQFTIPTHLYGVDDALSSVATVVPTSSGTVDCSGWFTGKDKTCYIAFFYRSDKFDANWVDPVAGTVTGNGRTYAYVHDMWIRSQFKSESNYTETYRQAYVKGETNPAYPTFIQGAAFGTEDGTNPLNVYKYTAGGVSYPSVIRFGAAFRPTVDKDSYLVLPKLTRPEDKNVGKDAPLVVKGTEDQMPSDYSYTFTAPGTYHVVVAGTMKTLSGEKKILKEADITVTE